ncbi:Gfo/Idh/MocA family protein [Fodinibius sediminis]|uniref:Tat (Twin-arginine translocation) pathway signal sequence n=1 Tax=Fodinibius sediminis TaxID=1214077 RepID=A0A521BEC3_9BACT|nr:Gfo/Idh/MocA family oxidoreductase [Fodinibius sediminis]SMO45422.1 Tat (twin-arginine translocation) pathway signal sequence [Fodinibius sediminis]
MPLKKQLTETLQNTTMDVKRSTEDKIKNISRRKFLGNSAALVGGALLSPLSGNKSAYGKSKKDRLSIALIGSGSRGAGATVNALEADPQVELVAMADIFEDMLDKSYENLMRVDTIKDRVNVPDKHKFIGLDAYQKAIDLADIVILATPPAFRPQHFEAAINAGKHVFMEKPLATDAPGLRKILATGELADQKGLNVVVGLQYRYSRRFQNLVEKLQTGEIGDISSMTCNYLLAGIKQVARKEGDSELEYQLRNWRRFEWLWGGSPAGLTIHFEDIAHWAKGSYPVRAFGTGGRIALEGPEDGNIYDHYYIDYEYEDGSHLHSRTRHMPGCWTNRSLDFQGSEGSARLSAREGTKIEDLEGKTRWSYDDSGDPNPYQTEHEHLIQAVRTGRHVNDTEWAAKSTMTSIMGRMAVQSGKLVEWEDALNSDLVLVPDNLTFDSEAPVLPKDDGSYPYPIPGGKIRAI